MSAPMKVVPIPENGKQGRSRTCLCPVHWQYRIGIKQLAGRFASPQVIARFARVVGELEEGLAAGKRFVAPLQECGNSVATLALALALERVTRRDASFKRIPVLVDHSGALQDEKDDEVF